MNMTPSGLKSSAPPETRILARGHRADSCTRKSFRSHFCLVGIDIEMEDRPHHVWTFNTDADALLHQSVADLPRRKGSRSDIEKDEICLDCGIEHGNAGNFRNASGKGAGIRVVFRKTLHIVV